MTSHDKKYCIYFEEIAEKILKNVPEQNKKYIQKQLNQLEKNFMDCLYYWNEKYYRNGFADVIELFGVQYKKALQNKLCSIEPFLAIKNDEFIVIK